MCHYGKATGNLQDMLTRHRIIKLSKFNYLP